MDRFDAIMHGMGPGEEMVSGEMLAVIEKELIGGECGYSKSRTSSPHEKERS